MKTHEIIVHPINDEQVDTIKAFLKALKIKVEIAKQSPYNPDFVAKILKGKNDIEQDNGTTYTIEVVNDLCK